MIHFWFCLTDPNLEKSVLWKYGCSSAEVTPGSLFYSKPLKHLLVKCQVCVSSLSLSPSFADPRISLSLSLSYNSISPSPLPPQVQLSSQNLHCSSYQLHNYALNMLEYIPVYMYIKSLRILYVMAHMTFIG